MDEEGLRRKVGYIVELATKLKNKHIGNDGSPVNYACIFSQSNEEYNKLVKSARMIGNVIKETPTGPLFQISPLETVAGVLKLLKIRIPDDTRHEMGDADFTVRNFVEFKKKYLPKKGFKLIKRENFEMIELTDSGFDVRAYFSNPPLDERLEIN